MRLPRELQGPVPNPYTPRAPAETGSLGRFARLNPRLSGSRSAARIADSLFYYCGSSRDAKAIQIEPYAYCWKPARHERVFVPWGLRGRSRRFPQITISYRCLFRAGAACNPRFSRNAITTTLDSAWKIQKMSSRHPSPLLRVVLERKRLDSVLE